jgi:hypothetical protein
MSDAQAAVTGLRPPAGCPGGAGATRPFLDLETAAAPGTRWLCAAPARLHARHGLAPAHLRARRQRTTLRHGLPLFRAVCIAPRPDQEHVP